MKKHATFLRLIALLLVSIIGIEAYAYDPNRIKRPKPIGSTDPLPEGWKFKDVGNISPPSDWCYDAEQGVFYLKSHGVEHWGSSDDQCGLFYFETDEDKQVTCRIMDAETVDGSASKGFLIIRAGLGGLDPWIYIEIKKQNGNVAVFGGRLEYNKSATSKGEIKTGTKGSTNNPPDCYPRWMRLVREGLFVKAYHKDDVEGAEWIQIGTVAKVDFKGRVYMGIGACMVEYSTGKGNPAIMLFDNLSVEEIELPYYVRESASVDAAFAESIRPGRYKDIDVTSVFGHAIGEYFTISVESTDPSIATAYFHESKVADNMIEQYGGESYIKKIRVTGVKEGVTSIRMNCTINGYSMSTDYAINVSDGKAKPKTAITKSPYAWSLESLEVPINQDLKRGEEFTTTKLTLSKTIPTYIAAWQYDWGGYDVGNYSKVRGNQGPTPNKAAKDYVNGAIKYDFRDSRINYNEYLSTKTYEYGEGKSKRKIPYMSSWFSNYTKASNQRFEENGSYINMAFVAMNDTAKAIGDTKTYRAAKEPNGTILWEDCRGFWTEGLGTNPLVSGKRGYAYLTNLTAGDWVSYKVEVPRYGNYRFIPVAATTEDNKYIRVDVNGITQVPEMKIKKTTTSSTWDDSDYAKLELKEGTNYIRIVFQQNEINFLGFKTLFDYAVKPGYSGLEYNTKAYMQPDEKLNTGAMEQEEVAYYNKMNPIIDDSIQFDDWAKGELNIAENDPLFSTLRDSLLTVVKDSLSTFPKIDVFDNEKIIAFYADQLPDTVKDAADEKKIEYIRQYLTNDFDTIGVVTNLQNTMKHIDKASFFYKTGFDINKPLEISMKIDSIANTGKGSYFGLMLRPMKDGEISSSSSYASFMIGSYEGGRLSYRWTQDTNFKKFDNPSIAQDVFIKIRLHEEAEDYLTAYYSYDNLFWWPFLTDPLRIDFLKEADDLAIGLALIGGNFTDDATLANAKASNLKITQYNKPDEFEQVDRADEMEYAPLTISPSDVQEGTPVNITFNVLKPGLVSLNVFDSYGVLVESIKNYEYMSFSKEEVTVTHTFKNLKESGIYMLRIDAPENEQYVRFRYVK